MKIQFLALFVLVSLIGCNKDEDPEPSAAEKQALLLAGASGQSKVWILTSLEIDNVDVFEGLCGYDNEYTFFNNATQSFEGTEGEEECTFWSDENGDGIVDPDEIFSYGPVIESGIWAFTLDGKSILISSSDTQSEFAIFSIFTDQGSPLPATVKTLTETDFSLEMDVSAGDNNFDATMTFEAVVPNS